MAEAAASQEALAVLHEQDRDAAGPQRLDVEDRHRQAPFEPENLAREQAMQDKHRQSN